jgi:hypothetical protein
VVIREIESPIIKETKVVTLSATEAKKRTFGKRQRPSRVYERKTGRNSMKKISTLKKLALIS